MAGALVLNATYEPLCVVTLRRAVVLVLAEKAIIIEAGDAYPSAGFVILQGCRNPHGSVELKRLVLQPKGLGYGRICVRLLAQMAFRDLGAHRFWLDVKSANARALALYRSEGFVEEGRLRESVRSVGGFDSLIVMSMLEPEYDALVEARDRSAAGVA